MAVAAAFLAEFLSGGRVPALSRLTRAPTRGALPGVSDTDLVTGHGATRPLVLVHGFAPEGKDEPRLRAAADLLARTGFAVAVPTVPGLTRGRLRPADVEPVVAALAARPGPTTLVAVSVGAGPALLAAADPRVRERVRMIVVLGGYASAHELARYFLTGEFAYLGHHGHVTHDPEVVRAFVATNADLLDASVARGLAAGDPGAVDTALRDLGPLLDALSPERVAASLPGRLLLVHGRGDRAVPYTETLRLAAARRQGAAVTIVGVVGHVEGEDGGPGRTLRAAADVARLWRVVYALMD